MSDIHVSNPFGNVVFITAEYVMNDVPTRRTFLFKESKRGQNIRVATSATETMMAPFIASGGTLEEACQHLATVFGLVFDVDSMSEDSARLLGYVRETV